MLTEVQEFCKFAMTILKLPKLYFPNFKSKSFRMEAILTVFASEVLLLPFSKFTLDFYRC
jgi:hypothetical protein